MGGKLLFCGIIVGCCLVTALSGCAAPQTSLSNLWLANGNPFSWFDSRAGKEKAKTSPALSGSTRIDGDLSSSDEKPELFAWRNRLKGYRLGGRLARAKDSDADRELHEASETSSTELARRETHKRSGKKTDEEERPTPSISNGALRLPMGFHNSPENIRPDFHLD